MKEKVRRQQSVIMISVMAGSVKYRSVNRDGRRKRIFAIITAVIVCLVIFIGIVLAIVLQNNDRTVYLNGTRKTQVDRKIATSCGMVRGITELTLGTNVSVFKGIPYAVPPVGNLRWKPPMGLKEGKRCWKGVYNATKFGNICPQLHPMNEEPIGNEDCLYLNVWTPDLKPKTKLPVVFVIQSEALMTSYGNKARFAPNSEFVSEMNVVAVSLNFRLGAFGFLALDILSDNSMYNTSGNFGLLDIIKALEWVKENIRFFGGDHERVTLIGLSSGGTAALALLTSPLARGLFNRVISMSGAVVFNTTAKQASMDNKMFIKRSGCGNKNEKDTLSCLYGLSLSQVLDAIPKTSYPFWGEEVKFSFPEKDILQGSLPVIDNYVIRKSPIESKTHEQVQVMLGSTAHEIRPKQGYDHGLNVSWTSWLPFLKKRLRKFESNLPSKVLQLYPNSTSGTAKHPLDSYSLVATDIRETCPTNHFAQTFSVKNPFSVYRYVVTNSPENPILLPNSPYPYRSAFHQWDALAFFGFGKVSQRLQQQTKRNIEFMNNLRKEFLHFIRYGTPSTKVWRYSPTSTLLFTNKGVQMLDNKAYHARQCKLWIDNGFFKYGWNT